MKVATYKYNGIDISTPADMHYLAYIVLPNGEYWGVRFNGATEDIARTKAIATWQHEQEKWKKLEPLVDNQRINNYKHDDETNMAERLATKDPWAIAAADKQHHLAGLVWMIHKDTREKKRIKLTEITMYEKQGYFRGGPRSK